MVKYVYKGVRRRYFMDKLLTVMNFSHVYENEKFYFHDDKTIYISTEDLTLGMLGHEMAHAIISHYFVVPPPTKVQEVLSGYVDYSFQKKVRKRNL